MKLPSLSGSWRADAAALRRLRDDRLADAIESLADQLDAALAEIANEPVTPEQAAAEGVCNAESARRAVREGRAENVGTPTRMKIPRAQLPRGRGRKGKGSASFGDIALEALAARTRRV